MKEWTQMFEESYNENWLPEELLEAYTPIECFAENENCVTLLLRKRDAEEKCVAKCYQKEGIEISVTENEILSSVSHKGLPVYIGVYENDQTVCVLRQYIEGKPFDQILKDKIFTPAEAAGFALKLCGILDYLHSLPMPVLHRDIKPENIVVDEDGEVYLIDFGISRIVHDAKKEDTKIAVTATYAPPEQFGFLPTDARSDIYALGVVLNEMLTGSTRLQENSAGGEMGQIIKKCTAFAPKDRYRSAKQLARDIMKFKYRNLRYALTALCALVVIAVGVFLGISLIGNVQADKAAESESIISGECVNDASDSSAEDKNASWSFDRETGVMTVSGEGQFDYDSWRMSDEFALEDITKLVIEEGISGIGEIYLSQYRSLEEIIIPGSAVGNINSNTFNDIYGLKKITVGPDSTSGVGWSYDFESKTLEVTYSGKGNGNLDGERYWHKIPCVDFYSIEHVIINEGVTNIGFNTFWCHLKLESMELPSTLVKMDSSNFADTPSLVSVTVHPDNKYFYTVNGALYGYETTDYGELLTEEDELTGFHLVPNLSEYIPDTTSRSSELFTHIDDNGKQHIGYIAEENGRLSNKTRIELVETENEQGDMEESYSLIYPRYSRRLYFVPRDRSGKIDIEPGTNVVGSFAFTGCNGVNEISIPVSVRYIDDSAFAYANNLERFDIQDEIAFRYDEANSVLYTVEEQMDGEDGTLVMTIIKALPSISGHYKIPEVYDVVYVKNNAFAGCTKLTEITVPVSVQRFGDGAFANCTSLERINLPKDITEVVERNAADPYWSYFSYEMFDQSALKEIDIPYGVTSIPEVCFVNCRNLTRVSIPETVTLIEDNAFEGCTRLENIEYAGS